MKYKMMLLILVPFFSLAANQTSATWLKSLCNGVERSEDVAEYNVANSIFNQLSERERVMCQLRDDDYSHYLIAKYQFRESISPSDNMEGTTALQAKVNNKQ